jgi:ankyrin repeat protein
VQLLLEHGANVNTQNNYNYYTPLHYASQSGKLEIARLLLDHGADVHIQSSDGVTPFQVAIHHSHHDIAQLLLDSGAKREEEEEDCFENME